MDTGVRDAESQAYNANLDYTLKELQKKVQEHQKELDQVSWLCWRALLFKHANIW